MKEITDRNLFGIVLKGLDGDKTKVRIIENSGETTVGIVNGYTKGGYIIKGEQIPAAAQILTDDALCRIVLENINQLFIVEE